MSWKLSQLCENIRLPLNTLKVISALGILRGRNLVRERGHSVQDRVGVPLAPGGGAYGF